MPEGAPEGASRSVVPIEALRCRRCGALDPGPREFCAVCHADDLEASRVPGTGRLVSWTVIRRAPTRFKGRAPYAIAVVDLDAGVRVTGRLRGDLDGVRIGAAVGAVAHEDGAYLFEEKRRRESHRQENHGQENHGQENHSQENHREETGA